MKTLSKFKNKLLKSLSPMLQKQTNLHPYIYFIWLLYHNQFLNDQSSQIYFLLYLVAISLALIANMNMLYAFVPFMRTVNIGCSLLVLIIGVLGSNQKWKITVFLFSVGQQIAYFSEDKHAILMVLSLLLCLCTYHFLFFKTISENQQYFIGFFTIFTYQLSQHLLQTINYEIDSKILLWLLMGGIVTVGLKIMKRRINQIGDMNFGEIKSSCLMVHFLKIIQKQLYEDINQNRIYRHSLKCQNNDCFCKKSNDYNRKRQCYLRQLYQKHIQNTKQIQDTTFIQNYIELLTKNGYIINSLHFILKLPNNHYFLQIAKMRCRARISKLMEDQTVKISYTKQYQYALNYDRLLKKIIRSVHKIIQIKIKFWKQAAAITPRLNKLKEHSQFIISSMFRLNQLYSFQIKPIQAKLNCFQATILYCIYLSETTNFTQYSETVSKTISKKIMNINEQKQQICQTYAVRVELLYEDISYIQHPLSKSKEIPNQINQAHQKGNKIKLIIVQISSGLCNLLKRQKQELKGNQLQSIIPDHYKEIHQRRLTTLLQHQSHQIPQYTPSNVLHKILVLPIKGKEKQLFIGQISIKMSVDIQNQLSFTSVIKLTQQNSCTAIINFQGEITEMQNGFNLEVIEHQHIQQSLTTMKKQWVASKSIVQKLLAVKFDNQVYQIKISSPLSSLFLSKSSLKNKNPPFHVQIVNSTQKPNTSPSKPFLLLNQIKNNNNCQLKSRCALQADTTSNSNSNIISILQRYCERKTVPIFKYISISFTIIILFCFATMIINSQSGDLSWDNRFQDGNPILDLLNMRKVASLTVEAALNIRDFRVLHQDTNKTVNFNKISEYFGISDYSQYQDNEIQQLQEQYRQIILQTKQSKSILLRQLMQESWNKQVQYLNYTFGKTSNPIFINTKVCYFQLMANYIIDLCVLSKNQNVKPTILETTYDQQIIDIQKIDYYSQVIDQQIEDTMTVVLYLNISLAVVIVLLLIPLIYTLNLRIQYHVKPYDLVTSVNSKLILKQIKQISRVQHIFSNYYSIIQNNPDDRCNYSSLKNRVRHNTIYEDSQANNDRISKINKHKEFNDWNSIKMINYQHQSNTSQQQQTYVQFRKKAGELDLTDSQYDPSNRIKLKHILIYSMVLVYLPFIYMQTVSDLNQLRTIISKKDRVISTFDKLIDNHIAFLLAKQYLRKGPLSNINIEPPWGLPLPKDLLNSGVSYGALYLKSIINGIPAYQYNTSDGFESIEENCKQNNSDLGGEILRKYCWFDYSFTVLKGEFGSLLKMFAQLRFINDAQKKYNSSYVKDKFIEINQNLSEKIYYLQSLNKQIQEKVQEIVTMMFQDILQNSVKHRNQETKLLVTAIAWTILTVFAGLGVIMMIRSQYLMEVYMLSLLSGEMAIDNKLIESYIQSIGKSMIDH